ncbi:MAG: hypothetical protein U0941_18115 [Planctomycetaceae bacterium]
MEIRSESGRELNLLFETDAPKRNTRYGINLTKDDVIYLLESVAENMPGLTETFVKCLSRIIEKNVECVGRISKTLKSLEVYGPEKRAIEDLLSDVRPEQS